MFNYNHTCFILFALKGLSPFVSVLTGNFIFMLSCLTIGKFYVVLYVGSFWHLFFQLQSHYHINVSDLAVLYLRERRDKTADIKLILHNFTVYTWILKIA